MPAIRLVPTLLGGGTVVLCGLIASEMGGGRTSQGLAALAALCAPVYMVMTSFYSMNAIEETLWPLAMLILLRLLNGADRRWWLVLGGIIAAGLLNKLSMLWFGVGLAVGLVLTPARQCLRTPWPWAAAVIALAGLMPFVWWQARHDLPFVEFSRNAAQYKVGEVTVLAFLREQMLAMNVLGTPLWIASLVYAWASSSLRPYRPLAWVFVTGAAILVLSGSARPHYLAPAYAAVFAPAAITVERWAGW